MLSLEKPQDRLCSPMRMRTGGFFRKPILGKQTMVLLGGNHHLFSRRIGGARVVRMKSH